MTTDDKATLRTRAKLARSKFADATDPPLLGWRAAEFYLSSSLMANTQVAAYWPLETEFDTRPLLFHLAKAGRRICLPVVADRGSPLSFHEWMPHTHMKAGYFGVSVPPADAPIMVPTLLLVPLLAFDRQGNRLGYGGGYYDRTLAELRARDAATTAVGVAFAMQEVDKVPVGAYDQPLDWVLTERELHPIGRDGGT